MIKLYHVYDPMCSWCWAFQKVWAEVKQALEDKVEIVYVLGGLAPDSDVLMPVAMQKQIAAYWQNIEAQVGTQFNHDFWRLNTPRRSTYPACRAVLAARKQDAEVLMITAIQQAYYLEARNPSDEDILIDLARQIELDKNQFTTDFLADTTQTELLHEIAFARSIGGNSFPSLFAATITARQGDLVVEEPARIYQIPINYQDASSTISQVLSLALK